MKFKTAAFFAIWGLFASTFAHAQNFYRLIGMTKDKNMKFLTGATIKLLKPSDSSWMKSTVTDQDGRYMFWHLEPGEYQLVITNLGYSPYRSGLVKVHANTMVPTVILQLTSTLLSEVHVAAEKSFVEQKIDRTVVNVGSLISNSGGSAWEALQKSPGVNVDQNGVVTFKGKGATIFIDDKPTYISGADLLNYLQSLPASSLAQIELMTNPPSNYDAGGNGGIINIRTKKNKIKGFNGGLNLSYIQGNYGRTNNGLNLNYRNNKINLFGNFGFSTNNVYNNLNINRHFQNSENEAISNFVQNSFIRNNGQTYTGKVGFDFYASAATTIGMGISGLYHPNHQRSLVSSQFSDPQNKPDSIIRAENNERKSFKNGTLNFNYRHEFNKHGRELTADIDYLNYNTLNRQSFVNTSFLSDGTLKNADTLTGHLPTNINIYSAKMDYTTPLNNGIKLSTGIKTSITQTDNTADYFYPVNNLNVVDYTKTNHFRYRENINAGYVNAGKEYKRITLQAGLRIENTFSQGHQLGNIEKPDSSFKRNYTNVFPTFYVQYKLDSAGNHQLGLNFGRRIDRPYYQDLNPFLSPIDKFTYYTGNPFLTPSFTNSLDISHTFKNRITTSLSYSKSFNQVNETIEILDGIYYSKPNNIGSATFKSLSVDGNLDPLSWLNIHLYGQVSSIHTVSLFYTGLLNTKGTFVYLKPMLQVKLPDDWTLQMDGYYQSKVTNVQFIAGPQRRLNGALSKKLSASTTVNIVMNDIFHSYVNSGIINNLAQTQADYHNVTDTRTAVLSLSYRFGKLISGQRKHVENGADSEKSRVKN